MVAGRYLRARKGERPVYFTEFGDYVATSLYDIGLMRCGMEIAEPAIIETPLTTIVINPGDRAVMDEFGNIRIRGFLVDRVHLRLLNPGNRYAPDQAGGRTTGI